MCQKCFAALPVGNFSLNDTIVGETIEIDGDQITTLFPINQRDTMQKAATILTNVKINR